MNILLATDASVSSVAAARLLTTLNIADESSLTILTVTPDSSSVNPENFQLWIPRWSEPQMQAIRHHHQELQTMLAARFGEPRTIHRHGNVSRVILDTATEVQADLIVMGALGHSTIDRMLLGSVSDNVATHASASVLVVRSSARADSEQPAIRNILLAYDASEASRHAMQEMAAISWPDDTLVRLTSVALNTSFGLEDGLSEAAVAADAQRLESTREACAAAAQELATLVPRAEPVVNTGAHAGELIVQTAADAASDLIVLGDAGHSVLRDWIIGCTAKYVLRHAHCSVWISRQHRRSDPQA